MEKIIEIYFKYQTICNVIIGIGVACLIALICFYIFKKDKFMELFNKYKEVIAYLFFGVCTFLVSIITFYIFNKVLGLNEHVANIISWIIAVTFAYITNKKWVFESHAVTKEEILKEITSFFSARLATLVLEEVILFVGVNLMHADSMLVKIIAQVLVILSNYFLSKLFVFKKEK